MNQSAAKAFRREVLAELARRGVSQKELARQLKVPYGTLRTRLNSEGGMRLSTASEISQALQIPLSELIRRSENDIFANKAA